MCENELNTSKLSKVSPWHTTMWQTGRVSVAFSYYRYTDIDYIHTQRVKKIVPLYIRSWLWQILTDFQNFLSYSPRNLQQNSWSISHHTLNASMHSTIFCYSFHKAHLKLDTLCKLVVTATSHLSGQNWSPYVTSSLRRITPLTTRDAVWCRAISTLADNNNDAEFLQ